MTEDGVIIRVIQAGIEGYLMIGEITIETICGEDNLGIIIPFLMVTWINIGEAVIGELTMAGGLHLLVVLDLIDSEVLVDLLRHLVVVLDLIDLEVLVGLLRHLVVVLDLIDSEVLVGLLRHLVVVLGLIDSEVLVNLVVRMIAGSSQDAT
jgi:hypothetical protein